MAENSLQIKKAEVKTKVVEPTEPPVEQQDKSITSSSELDDTQRKIQENIEKLKQKALQKNSKKVQQSRSAVSPKKGRY